MFKGFKFANPARFLSKSEGAFVWVNAAGSTTAFVWGVVAACLGLSVLAVAIPFILAQVFLIAAIPLLLKAQAYITRNGITGPKGGKASEVDPDSDDSDSDNEEDE